MIPICFNSFRRSSTRFRKRGKSFIASACILCSCAFGLPANADDLDDVAGYDLPSEDVPLLSISLSAPLAAAAASSSNITNDVAAILALLNSLYYTRSNNRLRVTDYPYANQNTITLGNVFTTLFSDASNTGVPATREQSLVYQIRNLLLANSNVWQRSDISSLLAGVQAASNVWTRSDVNLLLSATNVWSRDDIAALLLYSDQTASSSLSMNTTLSDFYDHFYGTLDGNAVQVVLAEDPNFQVILEEIQDSTTTITDALHPLDYILSGSDTTISNTLALQDLVTEIRDYSENLDVTLVPSLTNDLAGVLGLLELIHVTDFDYEGTGRSVQSDFAALNQQLGFSSNTLAGVLSRLSAAQLENNRVSLSNYVQNRADSLQQLESEASAGYTGDEYPVTNSVLPAYIDLVDEGDTSSISGEMSSASHDAAAEFSKLQGAIGEGNAEIVVIPYFTVGGITVPEYRASLETTITPVCRRVMRFIWGCALFGALFSLCSAEWAFYANLGRNWTMAGGFHETKGA